MITRSMVTLGKPCNNGKIWVTMKIGGKRVGVIQRSKLRQGEYTWRELGFNTKQNTANSKSEALARLLLRVNGGHG